MLALNIDGVNDCLIVSRSGTSELPQPEKYEIRLVDPHDWNSFIHPTGMDRQHDTYHHARYGHHTTAKSPDKALYSIFKGIAVYSHPPSILHESVPLDVSVLLVKVACHLKSRRT